MGLIRKSTSIATFGLVNFRSKSEKLDRVRGERDALQLDLLKAEKERKKLEARAERARARAEAAELDAVAHVKRSRRRATRRKAAAKGERTARRLRRRAEKVVNDAL